MLLLEVGEDFWLLEVLEEAVESHCHEEASKLILLMTSLMVKDPILNVST
jgi:hypothetical protein